MTATVRRLAVVPKAPPGRPRRDPLVYGIIPLMGIAGVLVGVLIATVCKLEPVPEPTYFCAPELREALVSYLKWCNERRGYNLDYARTSCMEDARQLYCERRP